jgi:hypothetical protein
MNSYIVGSKMLGLSNCHDTDVVYYGDVPSSAVGEGHFIYKNITQ